MLDFEAPPVDAPRMRRAGKSLLSLALMDARNHTLRWSHAFEDALAHVPADGQPPLVLPQHPLLDPPGWLLGHVGWFQEQVVLRNVQRHRGATADLKVPRLASIDHEADALFDPSLATPARRARLTLPPLPTIRQYLIDTLETTLELLERSEEDDDGLYFFRLALFHEEWQAERFAVMAQATGFDAGLVPPLESVLGRDPLTFPATRWTLGSPADGSFAFDTEQPAHDIDVPEFEIDAQSVSWSQFCEFVEDGGYDERGWWSDEGWAWLQKEGRRSPRYVDQMRHAVMLQRFGRVARVPLHQPAMHLSWYEADAWCRWAGRRLPTEVEWEMAAYLGASRGLRVGDVWEWTAGTARPYPGHVPGPWSACIQPRFGQDRVLRGGSFATRTRVRHAKHREFAAAENDFLFAGFRSCAFV
jgi:ergothioneine biosynthesis protein EgtB